MVRVYAERVRWHIQLLLGQWPVVEREHPGELSHSRSYHGRDTRMAQRDSVQYH